MAQRVTRQFRARGAATKKSGKRERRLKAAATRHHNAKLGQKVRTMRLAPHSHTTAKERRADAVRRQQTGRKRRHRQRGILREMADFGWDILGWTTAQPGKWLKAKKTPF